MSDFSESTWAKSIALQSRLVVKAVLSPRLHNTRRVEIRTLWWLSLVGLALVVMTMIFVDAPAMSLVRGISPGGFFDFFFIITRYGVVELFEWPLIAIWPAFVLLWLYLISPISRAMTSYLFARVGFLAVAIVLPLLTTSLLKSLLGRVRPDSPSATGPFDFFLFFTGGRHPGMPSSHTTIIFAAVVAIGALWPQSRPILIVYALLVAASRMVTIAHYPSDVLLAALIGVIGALLVRNYFADRNIAVTRDAAGRIQVIPNPGR